MGKVKNILSSLGRNKGKIMKFLTFCSIIKFYISAINHIFDNKKDNRMQLEITINVYSLLILGMVFLNDFCNCFIPTIIVENFKLMTHFTGKGIIFILISIIFMNPMLGNQQNFSAYLLFCVGILSILTDLKFENKINKNNNLLTNEKISKDILDVDLENGLNEVNNKVMNTETVEVKNGKVDNPYEIPEDF